jgi:hypothetical protein
VNAIQRRRKRRKAWKVPGAFSTPQPALPPQTVEEIPLAVPRANSGVYVGANSEAATQIGACRFVGIGGRNVCTTGGHNHTGRLKVGEKRTLYFGGAQPGRRAKAKAAQALVEKAPPGFEKAVLGLKKSNVDNPFAVAWWMKNKGYTAHEAEEMIEAGGTALQEILEAGEIRGWARPKRRSRFSNGAQRRGIPADVGGAPLGTIGNMSGTSS